MTDQPSVSVVMPAHNAERFLGETIGTVQRQSLHDWELLIVDDASQDSTAELAEGHAAGDPRIRLIRNGSQLGPSASRNRGIDAARGEYVAFLDADDLLSRHGLSSRREVLAGDPLAIGAYGRQQFLDDRGRPLGIRQPLPAVVGFTELAVFSFPTSAVMLKLEGPERPKFDEDLRNGEDWDLWLRLARTGRRLVLAPDCVIGRRLHEQSHVRTAMMRDYEQRMWVLERAWSPDPRVPEALPAYSEGLAGAQKNEIRAKRTWAYLMGAVFNADFETAKELWGRLDLDLVGLLGDGEMYMAARHWCLYTKSARGSSWPRHEKNLVRNLERFTENELDGDRALLEQWRRLAASPAARRRRRPWVRWLEWATETALRTLRTTF